MMNMHFGNKKTVLIDVIDELFNTEFVGDMASCF